MDMGIVLGGKHEFLMIRRIALVPLIDPILYNVVSLHCDTWLEAPPVEKLT
ncbi:hypothetical protein JCM14467A_05410 [Vulcanisaeta sp. JCM 14467]